MKMNYLKVWLGKGRLLLFVLSVSTFSACEDTNCIKGEGTIETRVLNLEPFTRIEANGDFKVYLTQGPNQKVEVKGEPNILSQLETSISNNTWKITHRECVRRSDDVEVYITIPEVESLYLNGSGHIEGQNTITATDLPVAVNGSGRIVLDVMANKIITQVTGSGKVVLQGEAPVQTIDISGSGRAEAFNLSSENVRVNISGSGTGEVTALDLLDVTISGSGNLYYKGNPAISQNISGSGKVIKK
ncbi:head GIN domain-containing protein [Pontibacter pudoricolor]|uniref:head GIN domain-containing protein n=1 Tax=Pontibacter pudoricolor TaxID=2694930 RepID=UPI0013918429|nr:head GIN domain-containing protein [Pontibacter pudoricolor]